MEKISIIVPFFNAEKFIEKCLNNLLTQTYENLEIIVVDEDSTDNSENIVKKFEENEKIKYFKLKEKTIGVSNARNYGIEKATGKYFIFVDADDYIDSNLIENLSGYIDKDVDVVKYKINIVDKDGNIINKINGPTFDSLNGEEAFSKLCFEDILIDSPCLYMMKKELFEKNPSLRFTKNLYHEDFELMPLVLVHAKSVISTDIYGYYYVQSDGSIMRTKDIEKNIKKANDKLLHYDNMLKNIEFLKDKTKEDIKKYYTNTIILTVEELQGEERKKYIKQIKKRKMLKNIKAKNLKQLLKKVVLNININWYLKLR